ncbi:winged helix-turn-helix domain-containing protein [Nocardia carnea]|uniref:Winged helix-turn-helix domain-containing protein n=1 Tax=Nocardia carnea TaxID=37328 RepID=A0ABW7TUV0_9NOCA
MDPIDPDDPRPPSQQIANVLRAAILTRKLSPGERLPSGPQLRERFGVAKATAEQAVRILRDEGLVVSRKGSGVYVRERTERPVGLRPHIEQSFGSSTVTIDFAGFSGETLHGANARSGYILAVDAPGAGGRLGRQSRVSSPCYPHHGAARAGYRRCGR